MFFSWNKGGQSQAHSFPFFIFFPKPVFVPLPFPLSYYLKASKGFACVAGGKICFPAGGGSVAAGMLLPQRPCTEALRAVAKGMNFCKVDVTTENTVLSHIPSFCPGQQSQQRTVQGLRDLPYLRYGLGKNIQSFCPPTLGSWSFQERAATPLLPSSQLTAARAKFPAWLRMYRMAGILTLFSVFPICIPA